jgi:zinc and cadmium transporter
VRGRTGSGRTDAVAPGPWNDRAHGRAGGAVTLALIVIATLAGGAASVMAAAWLSMSLLSGVVDRLVSLSAGMLLATALLHMVPEAFESGIDPRVLCATLLAGLVAFFALEKLAVMRHSHHYEGDGHDHHDGHDRDEAGPGGRLILIGDTIHNFADGVLIAAAFLTDTWLGVLTTLAIAAHEIPQEIGDFIVLINAGYRRERALLYNLLSSLSGVLGGVIGFYALVPGAQWLPHVLMLAAASFVYIALADLVPDLHRRSRRARREWVSQFVLMLLGIAVIALLTAHTR